MIIVKVTYAAKPEFVVQNSANISAVMNELRNMDSSGIFYNVCLGPDQKTFTHTSFFKMEEDRKLLNSLLSFKHFQEELRAVGLESPPKQELLTFVGSSTDIFK
jgi:hypothetical protein